MLTTIAGVYRAGIVELTETPPSASDNSPVIVTFLNGGEIDLAAQGIGVTEAADLRARLHAFAEDWKSPEMDIYDDYDANKAKLSE
jgi:hypothetical protein